MSDILSGHLLHILPRFLGDCSITIQILAYCDGMDRQKAMAIAAFEVTRANWFGPKQVVFAYPNGALELWTFDGQKMVCAQEELDKLEDQLKQDSLERDTLT